MITKKEVICPASIYLVSVSDVIGHIITGRRRVYLIAASFAPIVE
jgi:hypothetical protein